MEICQVQLMSLAEKIHDTEINHEIDPYLKDINALFVDTSKDELIKKFFSVEFTRFFNYYQKTKDLNAQAAQSSSRDGDRASDSNSARYFINVGRKDGYDWMSLKDFLRDNLGLGQDDVFKVDVKDSFSFFNTEKEQKAKILEFFTDFKHNGRFVNVEETESKGRDRNRGRGGKRRDGGGDRKRQNDGGFRSDRRSSGRDSGSRGDRGDRRSSVGSRSRRSDGFRSGDSGSVNRSERRGSEPSRSRRTASVGKTGSSERSRSRRSDSEFSSGGSDRPRRSRR
jgi:ATP-dependent RNA helicase DeaD